MKRSLCVTPRQLQRVPGDADGGANCRLASAKPIRNFLSGPLQRVRGCDKADVTSRFASAKLIRNVLSGPLQRVWGRVWGNDYGSATSRLASAKPIRTSFPVRCNEFEGMPTEALLHDFPVVRRSVTSSPWPLQRLRGNTDGRATSRLNNGRSHVHLYRLLRVDCNEHGFLWTQ
jgi:hypothetical protein